MKLNKENISTPMSFSLLTEENSDMVISTLKKLRKIPHLFYDSTMQQVKKNSPV